MLSRGLSHLKATVLAASLVLFPYGGQADEAEPATGRIDIEQAGDGFRIAGLVTGHAETAIMAELTIAKRDAAGQVSSTQSREISLTPDETQTLAQSTLSLGPDGQIDAVLTLSRDGIAFARIERAVRDGRIETR
jgi:hypothetical protein